jgi:hypothetical protein
LRRVFFDLQTQAAAVEGLAREGRITAMAKKKTAPKKAAAKAGGGEILLVGSKVKAAIKARDCNSSADAIEGLNGWVNWLISQATARAKANGRKTVRAHDFIIMG